MNEIFEKNLKMISRFETIPSGWNTASIKELCDLGRGRVISQDEIDKNKGIYPVYSSQTLNNGEMGKINTWDFNGEYVTWTTDGANAGTVFYRNGKFNCTNVCGTLSAKDLKKTHMKFLAYHLGRVAKNYVSYIGNPKLMNNVVAEIALAIPSYKEQKRIAEILTNIDKAIEKTEQLIDKYEKIKTGLMQDLLTGKVRLIGDKEWNVRYLSEYCDIQGGYAFKSDDYCSDGIQLIRIGSLFNNELNLDREPTFLPYEFVDQYKNYIISPNDIVISMTGTLGKRDYGFAVKIPNINRKFLLNQRVGKFILKEGIEKDFLLYLLHSDYFLSALYTKAGGTKQANLTAQQILEIKVAVPEIKEQEVISDVLNAQEDIIEKEYAYLNKLKMLKQGLMQDLLAGKVRVKVEEDGDE